MALILSGDTGVPASGMPTGSVIQTVTSTNTTNTNNATNTYADTGLTATITPTSSTSKILVVISAQIGTSGYSAGLNPVVNMQLVRNSTSVYLASSTSYNYASGSGGISVNMPLSITYLDSPATTSATTYKLQWKTASGNNASFDGDGGASTITLLEIHG
jgi:hypothetical protein